MILNSILLLLLPSLLFYATLSQDKLANPQVKITYTTSPPKTPKEFPLESELSKIANILSSGNISMLATTISAVTNNNDVSCKDKANYVTKATQLLKKRLTSNEQQLKILQVQPVISTGPGKNTDELKNMLSNLKNTLLQKNYDSDLKALEFQRKQINQNLSKQTNISNDFLSKLKEFRKKNGIETSTINEDKAILKLESELQALDQLVNQTSRKRSELHKNLTDIKVSLLNQQIKAREGISLQRLEADYRQYSQLALQASIKAKNKQQQLNRLTLQLKSKQLSRTIVDDEIDKATKSLQQKKGSNGQKAIQLMTSANAVLTKNIKTVQDRIRIMSSDCVV